MHRLLLIPLLAAWLAGGAQAEQLSFATEDFPPFSYASGNTSLPGPKHAAGPMVEIVQAACARLAMDCPIQLLPWRRALLNAEQGAVDGIFTFIRSPEREASFYMTRMLVKSSYSVYVREASHFVYHQPGDLQDRTIGVYGPSGTSYVLEKALTRVPGVSVHLSLSNRRLLKMLDSGRFGENGLVVANQDVAWHLIEEEKLPGVREAGELGEVSYGIGLSRASVDEATFLRFNHAIDELIEDGTIASILLRHRLQPAW